MVTGYPQTGAFPVDASRPGMDLLEYFTAAALQGLLAGLHPYDPSKARISDTELANRAVGLALATLLELHGHRNPPPA